MENTTIIKIDGRTYRGIPQGQRSLPKRFYSEGKEFTFVNEQLQPAEFVIPTQGLLLDLSKQYHQQNYQCLLQLKKEGKDNWFVIVDTQAQAQASLHHREKYHQAYKLIQQLIESSDQAAKEALGNLARLAGIEPEGRTLQFIKDRLEQQAESTPESILALFNDPDYTYKVIAVTARKESILTEEEGRWYYGRNEKTKGIYAGVGLEGVVQWLQNNPDICLSIQEALQKKGKLTYLKNPRQFTLASNENDSADALLDQARQLGIRNAHSMKPETLIRKIQEKSEEQLTPGSDVNE